MLRAAAAILATLRSRRAPTYGRPVAAISVLSNVQVTPEQLTWLMEQFKATKSPYGDDEWTIELAAAS